MFARCFDKGFLPILFVLIACGWIYTIATNSSSFTLIIEAFLMLCLVVKFRLYRKRLLLSSAIGLYLLLQTWLATQQLGFDWEDFARAAKPWLYLLLFVCVSRAPIRFAPSWLRGVILVFLVGYVISDLRGENRPFLIVENNFEIPFLVSIWSLLILRGVISVVSLETLAVAIVVGISASRSGAACFAGVLGMLMVRDGQWRNQLRGSFSLVKAIRFGWVVPLLIWALLLVFSRRATDLGDIDRVRFFGNFLSAMGRLDLFNVIFGSGALARVPGGLCSELSFYLEELAGKHGQCYSVVWHASVMRLSYDFGVIGFIVVYMLAYNIVRQKYSRYDAIIGLAPLFLAGLSVGGIYNFFSFLGLFAFYICGVKYDRESASKTQSAFRK